MGKAKELAEARLYGSWEKRFKKLVDAGRFTGASGFARIVKCMQETVSTAAISDDTDGGESRCPPVPTLWHDDCHPSFVRDVQVHLYRLASQVRSCDIIEVYGPTPPREESLLRNNF